MDNILKDLKNRLSGALTAFNEEMSMIRTNQPSPVLIEDLKINYFDQQVPIKQLGSVSVQPPRDIVISLWDASSGEAVGRAIDDAKRGYSVTVKGATIYITLPPLSSERREEMVKLAKTISEKFRIEVRQIRDQANKSLGSQELSEDMVATAKKKIQEAVDEANKKIEESVKQKTAQMQE